MCGLVAKLTNCFREHTIQRSHTHMLSPGALLNTRYRILDYIGEGGMGLVYKAHDNALDEIVAIKVLRSTLLDNQLMRQRFLSEIKLARRVTHKNVCRIHDYGEDGALGYISMQFVEGVELKTLARQSPRLSAEEACDIAIQLADGLQAIHDEGIIHRDFKSANVLVDARGDPRLMDFGIAKLLAADSLAATMAGHIIGTPEYMSPEQASGEPLDPRSDLYAMGIVLFEMFTGTRPFTGENLASVLYKQIYDAPPLDGEVAAAIPPVLKPIIQKALAKPREERYPSAREMKDALLAARAALASPVSDTTHTIVARVQAVREPPPQPQRITPRVLWRVLVVTSVLAIVVVGAWTLMGRRPQNGAPPPSPRPSRPATGPKIEPTPRTAEPSQPEPTPSTTDTHADTLSIAACGRGDAMACGRACDGGASTACTQLGVIYNRGGSGIARDLGAALLYYERGCNGGDLAGCNNLGTLYQFGALGLQGDRSKAIGLYERACNGGHFEACANLGALQLSNPGASPAEKTRARELLQKACASGITRACGQ
jgi:serine/threonine protein kinase